MIDINTLPLVNFDEINQVHHEEVKILNSLYTLLDAPDSKDKEIILRLNELLLHIREHFANEERLMKESYYQSLNMHKAEHGKIINEVQMQIMEFRNRKELEPLKEYFKEDFPTWLDQHILSMDITLAEHLSQY